MGIFFYKTSILDTRMMTQTIPVAIILERVHWYLSQKEYKEKVNVRPYQRNCCNQELHLLEENLEAAI